MSAVPPLRAVQVFEAVGRCGSITAAADELGVSPGAVTQQIHLLESFLKTRLIQRSGRGIELTRWGAIYLPYATAAMEQLRRGGREVGRARRSNHLTVSALPSLTNRWLSPLLFAFRSSQPKASLHVDSAETEPQLDENEVDFRISYVFPVGSPSLLASRPPIKRPSDMLRFPLLWTDWGPDEDSPPTWHDWFADVGAAGAEIPCDMTYWLSSAMIDAAAEGLGLALAQHSMVATALAAGTLVRLSERSLPMPQPYFLGWNGTALDRPHGAAFHAWLITEARRFDWQAAPVASA
jgi:LysR family glycine cleavage system transcriptional activator